MKNILRWCFKNITQKYPGRILILALLLSGFSIYVSKGLSYDSRMDNLLPQDLPLIKEFNEVVSKTGGSGPLVVVLEGLAQDKAPLVISQLSQRFKKVDGTQYVDSQIPKEFLNNKQLLILSRNELTQLELLVNQGIQYARDQLTGISLGNELFNPEKLQKLSEDHQFFDEISSFYKGKKHRNYYIFVKPEGTVTDTAFTQTFVDGIEKAIHDSAFENEIPGLKIKLTGSLIVRLEENTFIKHDLEKSALLAAFLVVAIILMYTRSWFSILLIVFPLLLSMTYTFAVTRLVIGHLNIISGFLVAILMGLGIDYGIHLYIRFKQELLKGRSISEASATTGEPMWEMPTYSEYGNQYQSDVADFKNTGGRAAGSITGAKLIEEFTTGASWAHLDIAGTSKTDKIGGYNVKGGTGVPVRTLIQLAIQLSSN